MSPTCLIQVTKRAMNEHDDDVPDLDDDVNNGASSRWLRWLRDLGLGLALVVVVMVGMGWARAPDLPSEAPSFTLLDVDGNAVSLSDFAGKTVVLNFWATWCGPCRMEAPAFAGFARAHPEVPVLGNRGGRTARKGSAGRRGARNDLSDPHGRPRSRQRLRGQHLPHHRRGES